MKPTMKSVAAHPTVPSAAERTHALAGRPSGLRQSARFIWAALFVLMLAGNPSLRAQLTMDVIFSNLGMMVNAPICGADGAELATPNFCVDLIYDASSIGGSATTVATSTSQWVQPGYFLGAIVPVSGFTAGATVTFHVRAWDTQNIALSFDQATIRNTSNPIELTVPQPPPPGTPLNFNLPLSLNGLQPFQLQVVPEPPEAMAISACACLALLIWRRMAQRLR